LNNKIAQDIKIGNLSIGADSSFFLIAGPCVIEDETITLKVAEFLKQVADDLNIPVVFKTSYDKANRTSLNSFRGPGIKKGLKVIRKVKEMTGLPVLSDVHSIEEVNRAAEVLDVIQIPAFLCRQTELILAVSRTGLAVNLKKGQFLSPWDLRPAIEKVISTGNRNIFITERGTSFGYNNLVVDIRSIPIMKNLGFPVIMDATHSVQLPGGAGESSGGQREFAGHLARAAIAAGADGVFIEVHPDPDAALCDGPNSMQLNDLKPLLKTLKRIHQIVKDNSL